MWRVSGGRRTSLRTFARGVTVLIAFAAVTRLPGAPTDPDGGVYRIDLSNVCPPAGKPDTAGCTRWYVQSKFSPTFTLLPEGAPELVGWLRPAAFPIWVNKLRPNHPPTESFADYSFVAYFEAPQALLEPAALPGLLFAEIGEVFEVFLNGHRVLGEGVAEAGKVRLHRTVRGVVYDLPGHLFVPGTNQLLVRIQGDPRYDHTGFYNGRGYAIADAATLRAEQQDRIALVLITLYLFVGLYHLLLALRRPQDRYNLYFGVQCVGIFIYLMTRANIIFEPWPLLGPVDSILIQRVELVVLYMLFPLALHFFDSLFLGRPATISRIYSAFCLVLIPPTLVLPMHLAEVLLRVWQLSALLGLGLFFYRPIRAKINGNADAGRLLVGIAVMLVTVSFDILDSLVFHFGVSLTKYGFFIFILGIAAILANRFLRVHNQVEELNASLERKVEERTLQLQKSLSDVRELKVQQDGDYYLTSLLIHPLGGNFAQGKNVHVDMLVRQKKRFTFRKWSSEIGGDLCTAHTIELRGRTYTAFLNGDAMGKSMQGAGGALVLGVVFKSVINRTNLSSETRKKRPERWLKDCFLELQNIFVTFDGTMLISAVMGLLDDESGVLYYINAEHPWVCLLRQGKARFIEHQLLLRKIGIEGLEGHLRVSTFHLLPDDAIFVGSDGRDDVALGVDNRGNRIINEDEYQFLRRVEEGRGLLPEIEEAIAKHGQLTDDFTLIRIGFREDAPLPDERQEENFRQLLSEGRAALENGDAGGLEKLKAALKQKPESLDALRDLGRAYRKLKRYDLAADAFLRCADLDAEDIGSLYRAAYTCKMAGRLEQALDMGESGRLRDPEHARNLINLADTYRIGGNLNRAQKILREASAREPENRDVLRLTEMMARKDRVP